MMKTMNLPLIAGLLQSLLAPAFAYAGTFDVTSVSYEGWLRDTYQLVIVVGKAKYMGEVDGNDKSWLIQTFLNDSYGNDLDDWANPDFAGAGKNGSSITPGMEVTCDGSCAANGSIDRLQCDGSGVTVHYKGKAGVVIYHQFSPEIDIDYGQVGDVACVFEEQSTNDPDDANSNPSCTSPELCTPIVLDLDGDGFRFSGLDEAVEFDLDGDGLAETLGWTEGADEAFLVLDRNGNGRIDDGTELFGGVTSQPDSEHPNGFLALRMFDDPAQDGTGDGWITADDAVYPRLQLWLDRNRDGVSQNEELSSLAAWGVEGIELDVVESRRRDRHGNQLRWASHLVSGNGRGLRAVDVIFVAE